MEQKHLKICITLLFITLLTYLFLFTDIAQVNKETIETRVSGYGNLAPIIYILIYTLATVLFLPVSILTIAGGFIFGTLIGTSLTVIGATAGAFLAFLFARYIGTSFVKRIQKKYTQLKEYDKKIEQNGLKVMLFLRLLPVFPFAGMNYAMGLTKMKTKDYFLGTLVGIIPGTFVYIYIGATATDLRSPQFYFALTLLSLLVIIPALIKKYKKC
jgi:uncharacterized membrane protein YdjX (TVP38/TMEM64 family)